MNEIKRKLSAICRGDGNRTREIISRALPESEVDAAVGIALDHVRAIPEAIAFLNRKAESWAAPGLIRGIAEYLTEPMDPQPETLYGAYGYLDDAYLLVGAAMVLETVARDRRRTCWGGLDARRTNALRENQARVRGFLHPDVAAFQDAMLITIGLWAEEACRQAAALDKEERRQAVEAANAWPQRLLQGAGGVYASL